MLGYVDHFDSFSTVNDNVERIHVKDFPPSEFIEKYERLYKPVVICGIQDNWKAKHKWTLEVSCIIRMSHIAKLTDDIIVVVIIIDDVDMYICYFSLFWAMHGTCN